MTAHVRTQVRNALVTTLTGLTTTGANVFVNRRAKLSARQLPGLRITTRAERITPETMHLPAILNRELVVTVEALVALDGDIDDLLDQIGAEVEAALSATLSANTAGGLLSTGLQLAGIGEMDIDDISTPNVGALPLHFTCAYKTASNAPTAAQH